MNHCEPFVSGPRFAMTSILQISLHSGIQHQSIALVVVRKRTQPHQHPSLYPLTSHPQTFPRIYSPRLNHSSL